MQLLLHSCEEAGMKGKKEKHLLFAVKTVSPFPRIWVSPSFFERAFIYFPFYLCPSPSARFTTYWAISQVNRYRCERERERETLGIRFFPSFSQQDYVRRMKGKRTLEKIFCGPNGEAFLFFSKGKKALRIEKPAIIV